MGAPIRQTFPSTQRRGWLSRHTALVFRCRWLGGNRGPGTPLFESAFVSVGLKCGSGKRRTWATLRFSRRARCPHRAVLRRPGVPPLRRESKPDSASGTGNREGRPYGFTKAYSKPWRAGEDTRPYGIFNTGSVCSVNPGAVVEPHQRKFMQTQGPVARREFRPATQILRAGNIAKPNKYASSVMGVLGDGRHGGRGGAAASADCARPLASFGSFFTRKRNSPRRAKPCPAAGAAKFLSENKKPKPPPDQRTGPRAASFKINISTNPLKPEGGSCDTRP